MVPSSTSMREVKRTVAIAWSPPAQTSPLLAMGTLAGAMDASFSTLAELEIYDLRLDDKAASEPTQKTTISAPSRHACIQDAPGVTLALRFNRLAWSSHNSTSADGVILGGCEDGSISFWGASELLKASNNETALLARCEAHHGAVRGLQVNPFQPFLVASGATDAEIWLWDLNNLNQPYSPSASKSSKLEDITDLAWNRLVPHILATASTSGYTVVWDLKSRKEVLQLAASGSRLSTSAIAWNPENATQILTATDDDQDPVIHSWDLRNARAPEKILKGHAKGILSMAWCPKDAELLLSCGKDNKSVCWNPKTGSVVAELTRSDNWLFDVQWCPRNPDIFSTASFSGTVEIHSFQSLVSGGGRPAATTASTAEDFFAAAASGAAQRPAAPAHVQIPKWLRRPIGISFGFGGRLVTFSSLRAEKSRVVSIVNVAAMNKKVVEASKKLDAALSTQSLVEYCLEKIPSSIPNLHVKDADAVFWNVAKVMFESNPQEKLMNLLGFDTRQLEEKIRVLSLREESVHNTANIATLSHLNSKSASTDASPVADDDARTFDQFFGGSSSGGDGEAPFDFGSLVSQASESSSGPTLQAAPAANDVPHQRRGTYQGVPFSLFSAESSEVDRTITKAIILGNFEAAVDLCVKADRLSDALLVAICGGEDLVARTQQLYFQKARFPYLRVVSGIVKKDISDVVEHAYIENWEEILALICSYAKGPTFTQLCYLLACRIEAAVPTNPAMATPALICFMAAGSAARAISLIISQQQRHVPPRNNSAEYAEWLESIVEKTRVLEQVSGYIAPQEATAVQEALPAISDHFIEYSYIMANSGLLDVAVRYFNSFSQQRTLDGEEDAVAVFGDRLAKATRSLGIPIRSVPEPFAAGAVDVVPEALASQSSEPAHAQAPHQRPLLQQQQHHHHQFHQKPMPALPQQPWQQPQRASFSQGPMATMTAPPLPPLYGQPTPAGASYASLPTAPSGAAVPPSVPSSGASSYAPMPPASGIGSSFGAAPMIPQPKPVVPPPMLAAGHHPYGAISPTHIPPMPVSAAPPNPSVSATAPSAPNPFAAAPPMTQSQPPSLQMQSFAAPAITAPVPSLGLASQVSHSPPVPVSMAAAPMRFAPSAPAVAPAPPPFAAPPPIPAPMSALSSQAVSPTQSAPPPRPSLVPEPPRVAAPAMETPQSRRSPVGAFNDPPMVPPRAPVAPQQPPMQPPMMMQPSSPLPRPGAAPAAAAPAPTSAPTPKSPGIRSSSSPPSHDVIVLAGPVDPSRIPSNMQPIYQAFNTLISQCQERALPMQRRIVEDSARRMQSLFAQLVSQELSPAALQLVSEMASSIASGHYERAFELHTPLMTSYFAETGAWILAAKRLVEVAKMCLR